MNGLVREYDQSNPFIKNIKRFAAGKNIEVMMVRNLYEPLYGTPERIEDFTREHCAYIEDWNYRIYM